jgi:hypothetical protein
MLFVVCFNKQYKNNRNKVLRYIRRVQGSSVETADHEPGTMENVDRQMQPDPYLEWQQRKVSHGHLLQMEKYSIHTLGKIHGIFVSPVFLNANKSYH